jgi:hypothetical protein
MRPTSRVVLGLLALSAAALHAQPAGSGNACGSGTLTGAYAVSLSGTRPNPQNPYVTEQMIGVAIQTFDGAGNFNQTDNVKGSQSGIIPNRPGFGTYVVNADCTGTFTLNNSGVPFPLVVQFVIESGGGGFRGVVVSPQAVMITAEATKI